MSNLEMFLLWAKELKQKEALFVKMFYEDDAPSVIYELATYKCITHWTINRIACVHDTYFPSEPQEVTKVMLDQYANYVTEFNPSVGAIIFYVSTQNEHGKLSTAIKLATIQNELKRYSFTVGRLIPYQQELAAKYAPREGHTACNYCNKQYPTEQAIKKHIYSRPKPYDGLFCSTDCAAHAQMAAEG